MSDAGLTAWAAAHARSVGRSGVRSQQGTPSGDGTLIDVATWLPGEQVIRSLDWTRSGQGNLRLACADGKSVTVLDGGDGQVVDRWSGTDFMVRWARMDNDTGLLTVDGVQTLLRFPERPSGTPYDIRRVSGEEGGSVRAVAFGEKQKLIATGGADTPVRVLHLPDGRGRRSVQPMRNLYGHDDMVLALACGGDDLLASGSADGTVIVWDARRGRRLHTLEHRAWVSDVRFAELPDGRLLLASTANDGLVRVWDPRTGELLHTLRGHLMEASCADWTVLPDGRPILATCSYDGTVCVWDGRTGACLAQSDHLGGVLHAVSWGHAYDDRLVLAAGGATGGIRIFSLALTEAPKAPKASTSTTIPDEIPPIEDVRLQGKVQAPGFTMANGLSAIVTQWSISIVLSGSAEPVSVLAHDQPITAYDWQIGSEGRLVVATGGENGLVRVWHAESGRQIGDFPCERPVTSVSVAVLPQGRVLVAAGTQDGDLFLWDEGLNPPLSLLRQTRMAQDEVGPITSARWAVLPDGRAWLASADRDGKVQIWDKNGFFSMVMPRHANPVHSLRWAVFPDDSAYLAIFVSTETLICDLRGNVLRAIPKTPQGEPPPGDLVALPDGRLLLVEIGGPASGIWNARTGERFSIAETIDEPDLIRTATWIVDGDGRLRLELFHVMRETEIHDVILRPPLPGTEPPPVAEGPVASSSALRPARLGLLKLGAGALWPALGLVADLLSLTGRHTGDLYDRRLADLETHSGIVQLKQLNWPVAARLAFVALLAARLPEEQGFAPPGDGVRRLDEALGLALATAPLPAAEQAADLDALTGAANEIKQQTVALLALIGPLAAAENPLLPLRLGHLELALPPLTDRQLRLLAQHGRTAERRLRRSGGGTPRHTPGTAGIVRRGLPRHMLHTDLALPADILTLRKLENQLLYRRHTTPQPPVPRPLTLVLDTTPPTYGTVEQVLRMAAHVLTVASWEHGLEPVLVTLTEPDQPVKLTGPEQLLKMWTSRTLQPPHPALEKALGTAAQTGRTTVLLMHHHTAGRDHAPGPATPFVTTRHPAESPRSRPAHPDHHELAPEPAGRELDALVSALLLPGAAR